MSTEQNYSAQDNCANPAQQPVSPAAELSIAGLPETTNQVELDDSRKAIKAAITSLQQWSVETKRHIAIAGWLCDSEKKDALALIQKHDEHLDFFDRLYTKGYINYPLAQEVVDSVIEDISDSQASLNLNLKWFELEGYRLPKSIKVNDKNPYYFRSYTAQGNVMAPQIPKGAHFSTVLVKRKRWLKARGVVCVVYHESLCKSTPRCHVIGRLAHIDQDRLYLFTTIPEMVISLFRLV
jgi:hypothetical protein